MTNNNKVVPIFSKYLAWELVNVLGKSYTRKANENGKEVYYFNDDKELKAYVTCYRYLANKNKQEEEQAKEQFIEATRNSDYPPGTSYVVYVYENTGAIKNVFPIKNAPTSAQVMQEPERVQAPASTTDELSDPEFEAMLYELGALTPAERENRFMEVYRDYLTQHGVTHPDGSEMLFPEREVERRRARAEQEAAQETQDDEEELLPWIIEEREEEKRRQEVQKREEEKGYYKSRFEKIFDHN